MLCLFISPTICFSIGGHNIKRRNLTREQTLGKGLQSCLSIIMLSAICFWVANCIGSTSSLGFVVRSVAPCWILFYWSSPYQVIHIYMYRIYICALLHVCIHDIHVCLPADRYIPWCREYTVTLWLGGLLILCLCLISCVECLPR